VVKSANPTRRLSNILYAFIRQAIREHRHGYPTGCPAPATDAGLVDDDLFGRPSLGRVATPGCQFGVIWAYWLLSIDVLTANYVV
jgi:hypothetical protein